MPIARHPLIFAIWPTTAPTAPAAPDTTTVSPGLRLADVEQAEVGGHAGHAERAQVDRAAAPARGRCDARPCRRRARTPARRTCRRRGRRRRNSACFDAMTRPTPPARITSPSATGAMYDLRVVHPAAHRRIERDVEHLDEHSPSAASRDRFLGERPVGGLRQADRTRGETELAVERHRGPRRGHANRQCDRRLRTARIAGRRAPGSGVTALDRTRCAREGRNHDGRTFQLVIPDADAARCGGGRVRPRRARSTRSCAFASRIPDDAFTAPILGTERDGNGVVIRDNGLIVTIGYLITEAEAIWITTQRRPRRAWASARLRFRDGNGARAAAAAARARAHAGRARATDVRVDDDVYVIGHGGRAHALKAEVFARARVRGLLGVPARRTRCSRRRRIRSGAAPRCSMPAAA